MATIRGTSHIERKVIVSVEAFLNENAIDESVDEIVLVVNGRIVKRMTYWQAQRMGMVEERMVEKR